MRRLTERLRGLVGKGSGEETAPAESDEATAAAPAPSPAPTTPAAEPVAPPRPAAPVRTVDAALAMLQAFPKDTDDEQRLHALRAALSATVEDKNQTLQQLLAEVLQEKSRIAAVLQKQDKNFELQQLKITEAVDALWEQRDRLTEHHQRITLQGKEHLEGLDNLIQCLTQIQSTTPTRVSLQDMTVPTPSPSNDEEEEDDGPVIIRLPKMELRPLGEDLASSATESAEAEPATGTEPRTHNPRKLYSKPA